MRPSEFNPGPRPPSGGEPAHARPGVRLLALLPFVGFAGLAAVLGYELLRGGDPSRVPSPLIGRQVPHFNLPALKGVASAAFSDADLRKGHVTLVNVFASWCIPCREERGPLLQLAHDPKLKAQGVKLAGIAYKDDPKNSRAFLAGGDPYAMIGVDRSGRESIDWGVYGVPETYIVKGDGTIIYKLIGAITPDNLVSDILPQIAKAEQ
ncbi:MAG TPA: DsbE family thiol:disulfide interchange protein [Beijerinckiaceae bacterium]|nr:DsbE family thiol:disulfide interchange protein [Beijerinckiaceae bacterium]